MGAIVVGDDDVAQVDSGRCIGCGICVPTCPSEAVFLFQRETITPPPDVTEFLTKRYLAPQE